VLVAKFGRKLAAVESRRQTLFRPVAVAHYSFKRLLFALPGILLSKVKKVARLFWPQKNWLISLGFCARSLTQGA
jgi:hypothetical protein